MLTEIAHGNAKGLAQEFLGGTCDLLGDSCGRPELPGRDADEALEVMRELALVREAGAGGDLRQGQVGSCLQELPGPLDAAHDDVLVRRQPGGRLEPPGKVVGAEAGFPLGVPLLANGFPAEAGAGPFEDREFKEGAVVVHRHAPLGVVIPDIQLARGPTAALLMTAVDCPGPLSHLKRGAKAAASGRLAAPRFQ